MSLFANHFVLAIGWVESNTVTPWLLGAALVLYLYFGTLYARRDKRATERIIEQSKKQHVGLSLGGGAALFLLIDALVFHSGFYSSFLSPNSFAGRVEYESAAEKIRPSDRAKDILVLGDSRIGEGFSVRLANERGTAAGLSFVDLSIALSSPRVWFYMLREVDPKCDRYRAIVIPVNSETVDFWRNAADRSYDIALAAPLLRSTDALDFSRSFTKWPNRCRAAAACLFRGSAFQSDLLDLLEHPSKRRKDLEFKPLLARSIYEYEGSKETVTDVAYDKSRNTFVFPERFSKIQRESMERSVRHVVDDEGRSAAYVRRWIGRIVEKYRGSSTQLVFLRLPRGPFGAPPQSKSSDFDSIRDVLNPTAMLLDADLLKPLESPDLFSDASHLNSNGREKFTAILTNELIRRLAVPETSTPASHF